MAMSQLERISLTIPKNYIRTQLNEVMSSPLLTRNVFIISKLEIKMEFRAEKNNSFKISFYTQRSKFSNH